MPRQLFMRLARLDNLPELTEPPVGYTVRLLLPGEEPALAALLSSAFEMEWTEERTRKNLTDAPDVEAVYVVANAEGLVATASARRAPDGPPNEGYLHWVGADPAHRGKGLGRLVSLRVLHHFRDGGCTTAVLETDDPRLPAIRSYLGLGFVPEETDPTHAERWAVVYQELERQR